MKRKEFSEEQIISILKEHETGATVADLARRHGVNEKTLYRWKAKFGGLDVSEARRLRELEDENAKLNRPRVPLQVPTRVNERWSFDFVSGQLVCNRRFRVLNVVDDYSRECVVQLADTSIAGTRVARFFDALPERRGLPTTLVCDNGPEFTSKAMFLWAKRTGVSLNFIQPGKPTQNAFVESFNGKFRGGCLTQNWFSYLIEARRVIAEWQAHYNDVRPHSSLGYLPPAVFEKQAA